MQIQPAALRILQAVSAVEGADDSLEAINTGQLNTGALVYVVGVGIYRFSRVSTATEALPNIVAPTAGGGRWFLLGNGGATYFQNVSVGHAAIGPASSVDSAFTVLGVGSTNDIVEYNLTDSGLPAGVTTGPVRVTGSEAALMRFLNTTAATIAAATVTFRMAVLDS